MKKRNTYSGEFKAKIVLELITGEKSLAELASKNQLNPNMIKNWKSVFLKKSAEMMEDGRRKSRMI